MEMEIPFFLFLIDPRRPTTLTITNPQNFERERETLFPSYFLLLEVRGRIEHFLIPSLPNLYFFFFFKIISIFYVSIY